MWIRSVTPLVVVYFLMPLGLLANILMLSGMEMFERYGRRICDFVIQIGNLKLTLSSFFFFLAVFCLSMELGQLYKIQSDEADTPKHLVTNEMKSRRWHHERDSWMAFYGFVLWAVAWRVQTLTLHYRIRSDRVMRIREAREARIGSEMQEMPGAGGREE